MNKWKKAALCISSMVAANIISMTLLNLINLETAVDRSFAQALAIVLFVWLWVDERNA